MAAGTVTRKGKSSASISSKRTQAIRSIIEPLTRFKGEYQLEVFPFLLEKLGSWQDPGQAQEIEQAVETWHRQRIVDSETIVKMESATLMVFLRKLHEQPFEAVKAVLEDHLAVLAQGKRDLKTLAGMKREVRDFFRTLTDRERYILASLEFHRSRDNATEYWDNLHGELDDPDFLKAKATEYAGDSQLAVLVKAFRLGESAYSEYAKAQ